MKLGAEPLPESDVSRDQNNDKLRHQLTLTVLAVEPVMTIASVVVQQVFTRGTVHTRVAFALVDVCNRTDFNLSENFFYYGVGENAKQ